MSDCGCEVVLSAEVKIFTGHETLNEPQALNRMALCFSADLISLAVKYC